MRQTKAPENNTADETPKQLKWTVMNDKNRPNLAELQALLPDHFMKSSLFWSMYYLLRDLGAIFGLYYIRLVVVPFPNELGIAPVMMRLIWWSVLSLFFEALFVIGHECMHGLFSDYTWLNRVIGNLTHSALIMNHYGSMKIHLLHHKHTNDIDLDTQYRGLRRQEYDLGEHNWWNLYGVEYGRSGNVFNPFDEILYNESERIHVIIGDAWIIAFFVGVFWLCGWNVLTFADMYFIPMSMGVFLINVITYLHHHHSKGLYYDHGTWNFVDGQLTTIDRSFGVVLDNITHWGTYHLAEHLFPGRIPHYRWKEATDAIRPALGELYKFDASPIPVAFVRAVTSCKFVRESELGDGILKYCA